MPEDESERGRIANERLAVLLSQLGWAQQGKLNVDVPCTSGVHTDRSNDHGVDGYFTYNDPYRALERGVFIESKIRKWENINISKMRGFLNQILQTVECVPEADEFQERLNLHENRNYNAGVLGVWSSDEFHKNDFQRYVSEAGVRRRERGTYEIAAFGNAELNKLARLAKQYTELCKKYDDDNDEVYFYYPSVVDKPVPNKLNCLSIERMISDIILARIETPHYRDGEVIGFENINIVYYFGDFTVDALEIVFQSLVEYKMLDADEVRIYYDHDNVERSLQDIESTKSLFEQNVTPDGDEEPEFSFSRLPTITYDSYADSLRGV